MTEETTQVPEMRNNFPSFHGIGLTYFKIWIVNTFLTIVTLGIYGPWAKVRDLKFLYGSTELNGSRFDFHGEPKAILRGRMIAIILFALYLLGSKLHAALSVIGFTSLYFLTPTLFVKSLEFRFGNTSYRNIAFSFNGNIKEAYSIWFKYTSIPTTLVIVNAILGVSMTSLDLKDPDLLSQMGPSLYIMMGLLSLSALYSICVAHKFYNEVFLFLYNHINYGHTKVSLVSSPQDVLKHILVKPALIFAGICLGTVFIYIGALLVLRFVPSEYLTSVSSLFMISIFFFYFGIVLNAIYMGYVLINYIWNRLSLGSYPLLKKITLWQYMFIGLTNMLLTIFTFGLGYPWAKMRMKKYIIENRGICIDDFNQFTGEAPRKTNALGEEISSTLDLEFDFGL